MIRTFSMGMMYRINYYIAINMLRNAISTFLQQQQSMYLRFSLIGFWFEIGQLKVMSAVMSSICCRAQHRVFNASLASSIFAHSQWLTNFRGMLHPF